MLQFNPVEFYEISTTRITWPMHSPHTTPNAARQVAGVDASSRSPQLSSNKLEAHSLAGAEYHVFDPRHHRKRSRDRPRTNHSGEGNVFEPRSSGE